MAGRAAVGGGNDGALNRARVAAYGQSIAACNGGSGHRGCLRHTSRRLHCRGGSRCRHTDMVYLLATLSNDVVAPIPDLADLVPERGI